MNSTELHLIVRAGGLGERGLTSWRSNSQLVYGLLMLRLLAVALGGALIFFAGYPGECPWLELFAFIPLLAVVQSARSWREASGYGVAWGLARVLPLAFMLKAFSLTFGPATALLIYVLAFDVLFTSVVFWIRGVQTTVLALTVAATFTAIELLDSILPMWGTARSLASAWACYPSACGVIHLLGTQGLAFVIVLVQALFVAGIRRHERRSIGAALTLLLIAAAFSVTKRPTAPGTLRVAAVGWGLGANAENAERDVSNAASGGARLVVFPEAAFALARNARSTFEAHWARVSREHGIWLVLPYWSKETGEGHLVVFDAFGNLRGTYTKRHLVPLAESYRPGTSPLLLDVEGVRVGFMICQDDNFRDLARSYAQAGAELLVVPTFEGPSSVAPYHFENSRLRSVENAVSLVRAVAQGTSAMFAPGGFLVATLSPERGESGVLIDEVPVWSRRVDRR